MSQTGTVVQYIQIIYTLYSKPLLGTIKNSSQQWESWGKKYKNTSST